MFKISITPFFRPRRLYGFWTDEFETVPSVRVLRQTVEQALADITQGMSDSSIEDTEENRFLRDAVYPKCLLTIDAAGELPTPHPQGKMKVHTIIRDAKVFGSIAIKQLEEE